MTKYAEENTSYFGMYSWHQPWHTRYYKQSIVCFDKDYEKM